MAEQIPTPTPEQVQQWLGTYFGATVTGEVSDVELALATQAARWGADQELEACCAWLNFYAADAEAQDLRAARRPKPLTPQWSSIDLPELNLRVTEEGWTEVALANDPKPKSLAEEGMEAMASMGLGPVFVKGADANAEVRSKYRLIWRALERLQELEGQGDG